MVVWRVRWALRVLVLVRLGLPSPHPFESACTLPPPRTSPVLSMLWIVSTRRGRDRPDGANTWWGGQGGVGDGGRALMHETPHSGQSRPPQTEHTQSHSNPSTAGGAPPSAASTSRRLGTAPEALSTHKSTPQLRPLASQCSIAAAQACHSWRWITSGFCPLARRYSRPALIGVWWGRGEVCVKRGTVGLGATEEGGPQRNGAAAAEGERRGGAGQKRRGPRGAGLEPATCRSRGTPLSRCTRRRRCAPHGRAASARPPSGAAARLRRERGREGRKGQAGRAVGVARGGGAGHM